MSARRGKGRRGGGGRGPGRQAGTEKVRYRMETSGEEVFYKCKYCGAVFNDGNELKHHKRVQHFDEMSQSTVRSVAVNPVQRGPGRPRKELMPPPPSPGSPVRTPQSQREEDEEESPTSETTESEQEEEPPRRRTPSPKKSPTAKRGRPAKNMPLPIGKKHKVTDPVTGKEKEEWLRNPKYSGA